MLDVDETLVCAFKPRKVPPALRGTGTFSLSVGSGGRLVIFQRPGLNEFLLRLSSFAEVVAFTAGAQGIRTYRGSLSLSLLQSLSGS